MAKFLIPAGETKYLEIWYNCASHRYIRKVCNENSNNSDDNSINNDKNRKP